MIDAPLADVAVDAPPAGRSLWSDARRRLLANRAALMSLVLLAVIALLALLAPWISPHPFDKVYWDRVLSPPDVGAGFFFGTDANGRDLFARTLHGGRVSLMVGIVATLVSIVIGVTWGAVAGYLGGRVDMVMMRIVDVLYSLPFLFFVILLMVYFGRHIVLIFAAIGAVEWLTMARIVRGQTLSLKRREFIEAARASGTPTAAIIRRHIVPNTLGPVAVYVTLTIPHVMLVEVVHQLPRAWRAGADDLLGRAYQRGRPADRDGAVDARLSGDVPGRDPVLLQLHRRWPARRA